MTVNPQDEINGTVPSRHSSEYIERPQAKLAALPKWTRITDDPATWPPQSGWTLFANHKIWGRWDYNTNGSTLRLTPGFLAANEYYWMPITSPTEVDDE